MSSDTSGESDNDYPPPDERLRRMREPLDFSPSSTAVDPSDAAQDVSEHLQTGRHAYTENATFTRGELPASSDRWDSLNEANRDFYATEESDVKSEQRRHDQMNDAVAWGGRIGLSDFECERAVYLLDHAIDAEGGEHEGGALILATLTLVANEDHGPEPPKIVRESARVETNGWTDDHAVVIVDDVINTYEGLREDLDISHQQVRDCRQYVRSLHK